MAHDHKQCMNCRWLEARENREGKIKYWCIKKRLDLGDSVLWRKACRDFRSS